MNTDAQTIIDNIPLEGKEPFQLPTLEHENLSLIPFVGKIPPVPGTMKKAMILFGHPGSGKSFIGIQAHKNLPADERDQQIVISYDEDGAMELIPDYHLAMASLGIVSEEAHKPTEGSRLKERRTVWQAYQADSQRIRALSLKKALRGGYNLLVDTTSTSVGTQKLIDALRGIGYDRIEMTGAFAPFDFARSRIENRVRPTSAVGDLVGKRIGAYEWLPVYSSVADEFSFYYNPSNVREPTLAFSMQNGNVTQTNDTSLQAIQRNMLAEGEVIEHYLGEMVLHPERAAPEDVSALDIQAIMAKHKTAITTCVDFLENVRKAGINLHKMMSCGGPNLDC